VVGGGGREHAIVRALGCSHHVDEVFCAPGNAGIAAESLCVPGARAGDPEKILAAAEELDVDLVALGPEEALVAGVADALEERGRAVFGPSRAAALIEGSKSFAKEVMSEAGVPTASHVLLRTREEALHHLARAPYPTVLKADGLAAGKGVVICESETAARNAVEVFFTERRFGEKPVLLEDFVHGEEVAMAALCDGENAVPLPPTQGYKRALDGDAGPNTGGMGSYLPVPGFGPVEVEEMMEKVHRPVLAALARRGTPFHGVLHAGLMIGETGPRVLEFNARPGDPETQAMLPLIQEDLAELFLATREPGGLADRSIELAPGASVTVVLASAGYPESFSEGDVIDGLEAAAGIAEVTHAGTAEREGEIVTAGGRVLNVTGLGSSPAEARDRAYDAAGRISFEGMQIRTDIAARAIERIPS
jgi:phosphoribosylamine--glycine ligase